MIRYKTDRTWFSHLARHPARKQSGSILTTSEPARPIQSRLKSPSVTISPEPSDILASCTCNTACRLKSCWLAEVVKVRLLGSHNTGEIKPGVSGHKNSTA